MPAQQQALAARVLAGIPHATLKPEGTLRDELDPDQALDLIPEFLLLVMPRVASYSAQEHLRDGSAVEIRALRPDDRDDMLTAIGRTSAQSLRRRFFVPKRGFSEKEVSFFMNIDFENHVALVAEIDEDSRPVIAGGGRYIIVQPGQAELAFVVIDAYQGKGIATALMRHLIATARSTGLKELTAEILPENAPMLNVFKRFGFLPRAGSDPQVRHLVLKLA